MPITDLQNKSTQLKELVSQFDTTKFFGTMSMFMQFIASPKTIKALQGLSSPLRQLYYVAALNLTSQNGKIKKDHFSDDEWEIVKKLLNEIEVGYHQFFIPKESEQVDEEWVQKRKIAMPAFLSYFNQGPLNYEEQIIERVFEYFTPLEKEIVAYFGLSISEFIDFYNTIDSIPQSFLDQNINPSEGKENWEAFTERMARENIMPYDWVKHMPENLKNMFDFMYDNGKMFRCSKKRLEEQFGQDKTAKFLSALTTKRDETPFLYYTEINPIYFKPLLQVNDDEYQIMEPKQLVHSIYNLLADFCINRVDLKEKFYFIRGDKLEDKIIRVFQKFTDNKAIIYKGFFTPKGNEQDILILLNKVAFIIEAKASKRKEPLRDPDKAYDRILSNFEETIQKGYDQSFRVKEYFIDGEIMPIYRDQELTQYITSIHTKSFHNVFSIVVTLEKFGLLQADLSSLLELYEDDEYPWSVSIDDLEVFLLVLKKRKKKLFDFIHFLRLRERLHGHLYCSDEMEVCGGFLKKLIDKKIVDSDETITISPDVADIFDKHYFRGGIGFENEKYMDRKTDEKTFFLGHDNY